MRIEKPTGTQRTSRGKLRQEDAETFAISALAHIAGDDDRLQRFLAVTGIDPANLRSEAGKPGFVSGVLDYLCSDEALLVGFAAVQGVPPESIVAAQQRLAPPASEDW